MIRKQLKERRLYFGMTQQELADRAFISRPRYTEIENGANISGDQMIALVKAFEERKQEEIERWEAEIEFRKNIIRDLRSLPPCDISFFARIQQEDE